ncbi:MAG: 2-octaprenyl-6-methoxyphenyl hydroxylase [Pseudomonadota bacterium]|jgi:2-octaprenyl-6-methoxyphenol hydroxylase
MRSVAIIGAGPVGAVAALALHHLGANNVTLFDAAPQGGPVIDRNLALSHGSMLLLSRLGVWEHIHPKPHPIAEIEVNQQGGFGQALIRASEQGVAALGYTLSYASLQHALTLVLARTSVNRRFNARALKIQSSSIEFADHCEASADLVVVADGGGDLLTGCAPTVKDPLQTAILCQVKASQATRDRALERFTPAGPLALLPTGPLHYAVVWTHARSAAEARLQQAQEAPEAFCKALENSLNFGTGTLTLASAVKSHALTLRYLTPRQQGKVVAIGNAAQSLHPIAGQGLNLGLRDAWVFAECMSAGKSLEDFANSREHDRQSGIALTQSLLGIFGLPSWANLPRGLGIALFDAFAPLKAGLTKRLMLGF